MVKDKIKEKFQNFSEKESIAKLRIYANILDFYQNKEKATKKANEKQLYQSIIDMANENLAMKVSSIRQQKNEAPRWVLNLNRFIVSSSLLFFFFFLAAGPFVFSNSPDKLISGWWLISLSAFAWSPAFMLCISWLWYHFRAEWVSSNIYIELKKKEYHKAVAVVIK
jgi:hypothetical protein